LTLRHRAFISLTVLGFALAAAVPAWSAAKSQPELRTASSVKKKTPAAEKTPAKTTETAKSTKKSTTGDDAKTVKTKAASPAKNQKKTEISDAASGKSKQKKDAPSSKTDSKTKLANACGSKAKLKTKACKAAQLAAAAEKKKADKALAAKLVAAKPITFLPAPFFPKQETPAVALNNGPVPYSAVAGQGTPLAPTPLNNALSPADAALYQTAFDLMDKADYAGADAQLAQVTDKSLMGYAQYHKLFSRGYASTYEELTAWLATYGDHPMAMKVWNLAKRKKPEGAPDPAFPLLAANTVAQRDDAPGGAAVQLAASTSLSDSTAIDRPDAAAPSSDTDLTPKSARSAYNNGQLAQAVTLGRQIGDHWVAGLACWRLKRYEEAMNEFRFVSSDPSTNAWTQSSGAYWAARSAQKLGHAADAETFLQLAASFPFTFYGLLAEERLGVDSAISLAKKGLPPTFGREQRTALTASLTEDFNWAKSHPRAQRLNALVQVGLDSDARSELQAAIQSSTNREERDRWLAFAAKTHIRVNQLKPTDHLFDVSLYPIPDIAPKGGYTIDKALIFAIARKESKFDAQAHSYAGAYGLLQLMPSTAALVEGDNSFNSKPKQLLIPAVNLSVGQNYINRLQGSSIIDGDLLRTIAAYNAGARPVKDALDSLGDDADSLLVMESIPVAQTRQYVEEVAANYWIYRQIMGKDSKTLAQAASDAKIISLSADAPEQAGAAPVGDVALAEN